MFTFVGYNIYHMKRLFLVITAFFLFLPYLVSQNRPFVTVWDLSIDAGQAGRIQFRVEFSNPVNFSWYQISNPSVQGSGSLPSTGISGVDGLPSAEIRLSLFPQNLQRFSFTEAGVEERSRLIRVEQWGDVEWTSMENAFLNCPNVQVTATDLPNLSGVNSMRRMFAGCSSLVGPANINDWNVSSVSNFSELFRDATAFNRPLGNWQTNSANNMARMFENATSFNHSLSGWVFNEGVNLTGFLSGSGLDCINYSANLIGWDDNPANSTNLTIDCNGLEYGTNASAARLGLENKGWIINGDTSLDEDCLRTGDFITIWDLSRPGSSDTSISFFVELEGDVQYSWAQIDNVNVNGSGSFSASPVTVSDLPAGETIRLLIDPNNLRRFFVRDGFDELRLIDVEKWGDASWTSMSNAFLGCENLEVMATDIPDLSSVSNLSGMFAGCTNLTGPPNIGAWDVSSVTNMSGMFNGASQFNQDLRNWEVSDVTDMRQMFANAVGFNQLLGTWNLNQNVLMDNMLDNCGMSCINYSQTLVEWAVKPSPPVGRTLGAIGLEYNSDAANARDELGWDFVGDSQVVVFINAVSGFGSVEQEICLGDPIVEILIEFGGEAVGLEIVGGILPAGIVYGGLAGFFTLSGTPVNQGTHLIILETIGGCDQARLEITITVSSSSSISLYEGQLIQTTCVGYPIEEIVLNLTGATQVEINPSYDWLDIEYTPDLLTATISGFAPEIADDYNFVISTQGGCGHDEVSGSISVLNLPSIALLDGSDNQDVCVNQPISDIVYFYNYASADDIQILGLPNGVEYSINDSSITIFGTPTEVWGAHYTIELQGCDVVSVVGTITVDERCIVSVPGGFSPNGDGINDFWVVNAIDLFPENHLQVFNRNGTLVYEEAPYTNNWDGRPNRGNTTVGVGDRLPQGVYFYQLTLQYGDPTLKGFVIISY